jgi:SAM-dependent methyltransferase
MLKPLIRAFEHSGLSLSDGVLALLAAMLEYNGLVKNNWEKKPETRLEKTLASWYEESGRQKEIKTLFAGFELPNRNDDIAGAFYQALQSAQKKLATGSYYTPAALLKKISVPRDKTVYDPCCGSGGILLNILSKSHDPAKIFAGDIDETALRICAVNLSLFFGNSRLGFNIAKRDVIFENAGDCFCGKKFDYIVTNPPWGSKFTQRQKRFLLRAYPELETTEIFSLVLDTCLGALAEGGYLYFFLPHAFLNVAAHKKIRQKLLDRSGTISLRPLGSVFKGVMSEGILLRVKASPRRNSRIRVIDKNNTIHTLKRNTITAPNFIINANASNAEAAILEKLYDAPHESLRENTVFAMGIVTGNNGRFIKPEETPGSEALYRGKDILPYRLAAPECFAAFNPGVFQQTAPEAVYRQRKIVYRFISGKLVCALDEAGVLLLNSANLIIAQNYPMETIVCLFNSPLYTFIFQKKFHSRKVLKSHLQELPLPLFTESEHRRLFLLHAAITNREESLQSAQPEIDAVLREYFCLSEQEFRLSRLP